MKSIITNKATEQEAPLEYPVLMEYVGNSDATFTVLFISKSQGMVVYSESDQYFIGKFCGVWEHTINDHVWKKFEGSVTLSN